MLNKSEIVAVTFVCFVGRNCATDLGVQAGEG